MSEVRNPHPPAKRRARATSIPHAPRRRRRRRPGQPPSPVDRRVAQPVVAPRMSGQGPAHGPAADRGIGLLLIFTAGVLVMVGIIALTAILDRWWVLGPVMAFDFAVTAAVMAIIARLLRD